MRQTRFALAWGGGLCYAKGVPSYTILFMRQDLTDRRPFRLHISTGLFWTLILLAFGLPILGFAVSAGVIAPAWLKINVKNMQETVEMAEKSLQPLQEQNTALASQKTTLEGQLKAEMQRRAEAEARVTMAETARIEASSKLGELEGELLNLRRSLATYERLLKPKLQRELVECVSENVTAEGSQVSYSLTFAKVTRTTRVPDDLKVTIRILTGNNAVEMEQGNASAASSVQTLNLSKAQTLKGKFVVTLAPDTTRLLDVKVLDGNTPVGYCWKAF